MKWSRLLCPLQVVNKSFKTQESFDWLRFPYWLHLPVPATASLLMAEKRRGWATPILVALQFYIFHSLHNKNWSFSYFKSGTNQCVRIIGRTQEVGGASRSQWHLIRSTSRGLSPKHFFPLSQPRPHPHFPWRRQIRKLQIIVKCISPFSWENFLAADGPSGPGFETAVHLPCWCISRTSVNNYGT